MDKKTQKILLFVGVGVVAYLWWKKREETSEFSNIRGNRRYKKLKARQAKWDNYCARHPNDPRC
jgi:hypothetical protein